MRPATQFGGRLRGDILPATTWANRPAANSVPAGTILPISGLITDGMVWFSNDVANNKWRLTAPQTIWFDAAHNQGVLGTSDGGAGSTAEQILKQWANIPTGLLGCLRRLQMQVLYTKSGTGTDTFGIFQARLGTAGTTADVSLGASSSTTLSATNRQYTTDMYRAVASETSLRGLGNLTFGIVNGTDSAGWPRTFTVPDLDTTSGLILSFSGTMSGLLWTPGVADTRVIGW